MKVINFIDFILTTCLNDKIVDYQANRSLPVHAGRGRGDDEVVLAQCRVRAARDGPRDLPEVLVEKPAVHQHSVSC